MNTVVKLAMVILEIERDLAKERQLAGVSIKTQETLGSNEPEVGRARDIVAKKIGVSPTTFQRAITIIEDGDKKLQNEVRIGKKSISAAYQTIRKKTKTKKIQKRKKKTNNIREESLRTDLAKLPKKEELFTNLQKLVNILETNH